MMIAKSTARILVTVGALSEEMHADATEGLTSSSVVTVHYKFGDVQRGKRNEVTILGRTDGTRVPEGRIEPVSQEEFLSRLWMCALYHFDQHRGYNELEQAQEFIMVGMVPNARRILRSNFSGFEEMVNETWLMQTQTLLFIDVPKTVEPSDADREKFGVILGILEEKKIPMTGFSLGQVTFTLSKDNEDVSVAFDGKLFTLDQSPGSVSGAAYKHVLDSLDEVQREIERRKAGVPEQAEPQGQGILADAIVKARADLKEIVDYKTDDVKDQIRYVIKDLKDALNSYYAENPGK